MLIENVYDRMGIGKAPKKIAQKPLLSVMLEKLGRLPVEDETLFYEGMKITPKSFSGGKPLEVVIQLTDDEEPKESVIADGAEEVLK